MDDQVLESLFEVLWSISAELEGIKEAMGRGERGYSWTPDGLPICPVHGEVMKKREKQGDVWYSHRVIHPVTGEELYCRGYPSKSGPGYEVQAGPTADGELSAAGYSVQEDQASSSLPHERAQRQSAAASPSSSGSLSDPVEKLVGPTRFWRRVNEKTSAGEIPPGVVIRKADVVKAAMSSGDFSAALTWLEAEYA